MDDYVPEEEGWNGGYETAQYHVLPIIDQAITELDEQGLNRKEIVEAIQKKLKLRNCYAWKCYVNSTAFRSTKEKWERELGFLPGCMECSAACVPLHLIYDLD